MVEDLFHKCDLSSFRNRIVNWTRTFCSEIAISETKYSGYMNKFTLKRYFIGFEHCNCVMINSVPTGSLISIRGNFLGREEKPSSLTNIVYFWHIKVRTHVLYYLCCFQEISCAQQAKTRAISRREKINTAQAPIDARPPRTPAKQLNKRWLYHRKMPYQH